MVVGWGRREGKRVSGGNMYEGPLRNPETERTCHFGRPESSICQSVECGRAS